MLVKTRWPALIPAIKRAGHEPVLEFPLEEGNPPPVKEMSQKQFDDAVIDAASEDREWIR